MNLIPDKEVSSGFWYPTTEVDTWDHGLSMSEFGVVRLEAILCRVGEGSTDVPSGLRRVTIVTWYGSFIA